MSLGYSRSWQGTAARANQQLAMKQGGELSVAGVPAAALRLLHRFVLAVFTAVQQNKG